MNNEPLICVLCQKIISIENSPRCPIRGHNAIPLVDGRCCGICSDEKVIPFRQNLAHEQKRK